MATNGVKGKASTSDGASVEGKASRKGMTIKLKKAPPKIKNAGNWMKARLITDSKAVSSPKGAPSPIVNELDDQAIASFATGHPVTDEPDVVVCKHCKKAILKTIAAGHTKECAKQKAEKLRKKKEAKEALAREKEAREEQERAKEKAEKEAANAKDVEKNRVGAEAAAAAAVTAAAAAADATEMVKSAKKTAVLGEGKTAMEGGPKKSKKRKADEDAEKAPKPKKKKEEPKAKVAKPKGPVDVEKQCGVPLPNGAQCARSLTCKSHSMGAKRAVPGRSLPYDMLLSVYQKKNQAKQQKAAIDANAPVDDPDNALGPIDSDEEKDAIMSALARSRPQPLAQPLFVPLRRKYQFVRMKGLLSGALGGSRGGGLFSTGTTSGLFSTASERDDIAPHHGSPIVGAFATDLGSVFDLPPSSSSPIPARKNSLLHATGLPPPGRRASNASVATAA